MAWSWGGKRMRRRQLIAALGVALTLPWGARARHRYELVLNLKIAKVLGFELPATLISRADKVIE